MAELILGTVQFGLNYGVTNATGALDDKTVREMLKASRDLGVYGFDTAADYGNSQVRLGELWLSPEPPRYITKFSLEPNGVTPDPENLYLNSMRDLNVDRLAGVLFHKLADLSDERCVAAVKVLRSARDQGVVERAGVSAYSMEDVRLARSVFPDMNLIQIPANILDSSLLDSEELAELRSEGCHIHVRSVFLQGLLLASPEKLPDFFKPLAPVLRIIRDEADVRDVSVLELVLQTMKVNPKLDAVVLGATSVSELTEIASAWNSTLPPINLEIPDFPLELLDPRRWPQVRLEP